MVDKRTEVVLAYKTDTQSVNKAIREADRFGDSVRSNTSDAVQSTQKLTQANANLIAQLKAGTQSANDYYDQVNQDVGLAGDVASNAAQVAGALDAIGASFAGGALERLVIAGDVVEGLPRLKTAVAGLPATVASAVSAIGVGGFGLIGAIGLGVVAFGELSRVLDEARQRGEAYAQSLIDASTSVADARLALARGDITGVIQQLADTQDQRLNLIVREQELSEELTRLEQARLQRSSGQLGVFDALADRFDTTIQEIDGSISGLKTSIEETSNEAVSLALTQNELTALLMEQGFTTEQIETEIAKLNETTQETTETVNELNTALLAQADAVRNRYLEEISLLDQTEQGLKARQDQIRAEIEANTRAIATLEASGDTSEQVTAQIEKYRLANEELGKTLEFIGNTALPSATARAQAEQAQADTEKTQHDMIEATKQFNSELENLNESAYEELYKIEEQRTKAMLDIAKKYADDTQKALDNLNKELEGARANYQKSELEARENALRQERDATQKHYEALSDISTNAKREEQDALRNLDFKGAFEARRNANRAIEDEQTQFTREQKDRMRSQADERQDRLRAYEQAQRDAQANYQKELDTARKARQNALREAEQGYNQELQLARNAQAQKLSALQAGYMSELTLAQQTASQRLAIQQALDAQLLASAQRVLSVGFGRSASRSPQNFSNYRGGTPPPNLPPPSRVNQQNLERQRAMDRARSGGVNININNSTNPQRTAEQVKTIINNNRGGG